MENLIQTIVIIASVAAIVIYASIAISADAKKQLGKKKKANLYKL